VIFEVADFLPSAFVLAIAGLISAIGGLISTIMAARRARSEERVVCEDRVRSLREENNRLSDEVYALRHPGERLDR
jgi:hypothetical protein